MHILESNTVISPPSASQSIIPPVDPEVDPAADWTWTVDGGRRTRDLLIAVHLSLSSSHKQLITLAPITPFPFLRSREP